MNNYKALITYAVISLMTCLLCFWLAVKELMKHPIDTPRTKDIWLAFVYAFAAAVFLAAFIFTIEALVHL